MNGVWREENFLKIMLDSVITQANTQPMQFYKEAIQIRH